MIPHKPRTRNTFGSHTVVGCAPSSTLMSGPRVHSRVFVFTVMCLLYHTPRFNLMIDFAMELMMHNGSSAPSLATNFAKRDHVRIHDVYCNVNDGQSNALLLTHHSLALNTSSTALGLFSSGQCTGIQETKYACALVDTYVHMLTDGQVDADGLQGNSDKLHSGLYTD